MNDLRQRVATALEPYVRPEEWALEVGDAAMGAVEIAIREAARHQEDDSRALGMMDAADMIREARRNGLRALGSRFVQRVPIPQGIMPKTKEDT